MRNCCRFRSCCDLSGFIQIGTVYKIHSADLCKYNIQGVANQGVDNEIRGIRFADAIREWGPLIAHVCKQTAQFAYGKLGSPSPPSS